MKEIIYPYLLECCKFTDDKYWKGIFEDLAYGIAPHGTYFHKGFLTCNYKNKQFSYKITEKDACEIYNDICDILKTKLGMCSRTEIVEKKNVIVDSSEETDNWSDIKKKNLREILIEKYCLEMKKKHSLSLKETRYLLSTIFVAFIFKAISSDDIAMENGKITEIKGISFENGKINFDKELYDIETNVPEIITSKKTMAEEWQKYLGLLRKA